MALDQFVSKLNAIINAWVFEINVRTLSCPSLSEQSSQTSKATSYRHLTLCMHKEILRRRNLKVHTMHYSSNEIWEEIKVRDPLWNHWPQMQTLRSGFTGELYLKFTMPSGFNSRRHGGDNRKSNPFNNIHHFYSAFGTREEILDLRDNKLN